MKQLNPIDEPTAVANDLVDFQTLPKIMKATRRRPEDSKDFSTPHTVTEEPVAYVAMVALLASASATVTTTATRTTMHYDFHSVEGATFSI